MAQNVKLTNFLVAAIEFAASSYPRKVPSKVEKTIFVYFHEMVIFGGSVLAHNVRSTASPIVTSEFLRIMFVYVLS